MSVRVHLQVGVTGLVDGHTELKENYHCHTNSYRNYQHDDLFCTKSESSLYGYTGKETNTTEPTKSF